MTPLPSGASEKSEKIPELGSTSKTKDTLNELMNSIKKYAGMNFKNEKGLYLHSLLTRIYSLKPEEQKMLFENLSKEGSKDTVIKNVEREFKVFRTAMDELEIQGEVGQWKSDKKTYIAVKEKNGTISLKPFNKLFLDTLHPFREMPSSHLSEEVNKEEGNSNAISEPGSSVSETAGSDEAESFLRAQRKLYPGKYLKFHCNDPNGKECFYILNEEGKFYKLKPRDAKNLIEDFFIDVTESFRGWSKSNRK